MMLVSPKLRVIHVTTHIGLLDAIEKIEPGLVERVITRGHEVLVRAGIANPKIGVCAINPHAGENGLFGRGEEAEKITPAVEACQAKGWDVRGPLPADTLFFLAGRGDYDMVVAMYHDQGHGPIKVLGLEAGVNITVGLPVIRTSVDHGTAFDIAGKGIADERSLIEALRQAVDSRAQASGSVRRPIVIIWGIVDAQQRTPLASSPRSARRRSRRWRSCRSPRCISFDGQARPAAAVR